MNHFIKGQPTQELIGGGHCIMISFKAVYKLKELPFKLLLALVSAKWFEDLIQRFGLDLVTFQANIDAGK